MGASTTLIIAGVGCLILSVFMLRLVLPREGKAPSAWTSTEMRAMATALLFMLLLIAGGLMLAKAFI